MDTKGFQYARELVGAWQSENKKSAFFFSEPDIKTFPDWKVMIFDDLENRFVTKEIVFIELSKDKYEIYFKGGLNLFKTYIKPIDTDSFTLVMDFEEANQKTKDILRRVQDIKSFFEISK
jgi:hypothetical protein